MRINFALPLMLFTSMASMSWADAPLVTVHPEAPVAQEAPSQPKTPVKFVETERKEAAPHPKEVKSRVSDSESFWGKSHVVKKPSNTVEVPAAYIPAKKPGVDLKPLDTPVEPESRLLTLAVPETEKETSGGTISRLTEMRLTPADDARLLRHAKSGASYDIIERRGDWIKIALSSSKKTGWIRVSGTEKEKPSTVRVTPLKTAGHPIRKQETGNAVPSTQDRHVGDPVETVQNTVPTKPQLPVAASHSSPTLIAVLLLIAVAALIAATRYAFLTRPGKREDDQDWFHA